MFLRIGATAGRWLTWLAGRFPHFPDPKAICPAHGNRYCRACSRNPGDCIGDCGGCGYWSATGMHWDTCPNRVRGDT